MNFLLLARTGKTRFFSGWPVRFFPDFLGALFALASGAFRRFPLAFRPLPSVNPPSLPRFFAPGKSRYRGANPRDNGSVALKLSFY
jgi:hypothetical protein